MLGYTNNTGFPCDSTGKKAACSVGDPGSIPGLGRSPWRRERLRTPVFWPGEFPGLYSPWGRKESDTTDFHFHIQTTHNNFSHLFPVRNAIYSSGVIILKEQ